jgi:hypothetical protein
MSRAESEALARGCHSAWLDTFEFQARVFFERLGYECFGTLDHYPGALLPLLHEEGACSSAILANISD